MSAQPIAGIIRHPDSDQPWSGARLVFRLVQTFASTSGTRPPARVPLTADSTGAIAGALAVPDDGSPARYELTIERGTPIYFDLAASDSTTRIENLIATGTTPSSALTGLAAQLAAERNARIAGDQSLAQQLAALELPGLDELIADLEQERSERIAGDQAIADQLAALELPGLDELIADLEQERTERIADVQQLADRLAAVEQPHTHDHATLASAGFMSPAQVQQLAGAASLSTAQSWTARQTFTKQTTITGEAGGYALQQKRDDGPTLLAITNEGQIEGAQRGYVWVNDHLVVSAGKRATFGGGAINVYGSGNEGHLTNGAQFDGTSWSRTIANYLPQLALQSSQTEATIAHQITDETTGAPAFLPIRRWRYTPTTATEETDLKTSIQARTVAADRIELSTSTDANHTARRRIELARSGQRIEAARIDTESSPTQIGIMLLHDGTLKRVEAGPADSAGAGYRALRVTN